MITAIMQPTYLPWSGYFSLMAQCECFVFLDDVQFDRRSWQSRNRIAVSGKEHFLSVTTKKAPRDALIQNICINDSTGWRKKHQKTLETLYRKSAFGGALIDPLNATLGEESLCYLANLNIALISVVARTLDLTPKFVRASELHCGGKRSHHLLEICRTVGASGYISPAGSQAYLAEDGFTDVLGDVPMKFHRFTPSPYLQKGCKEFIPYLSIVDVIANIGPDSTKLYLEENAQI